MTEHTRLTWLNHGKNVANHLQSLWNKEMFVDSTIVCNGQYFPAHRFVLSSCSSYFEGILAKVPCQHPFLIMNEVDTKDLEALLNFMYRGKTTVLMDRLLPLLRAAKALKIKGLETLSDPVSSPNAEMSCQDEEDDPSDLPPSHNQEFERTQLSPKSLLDQCLGFEQEMKLEAEDCNQDNDSPSSPPSLQLEHVMSKVDFSRDGPVPRLTPPITTCAPYIHSQCEDEATDRSSRRLKVLAARRSLDKSKTFNCSICDYGTKYGGDLRKHLRTHTGEKPFVCDKCPFMTSDSSSLKNHTRSHSGERPFQCQACSFSTTNQATLKKHLKIHSTSTQQDCLPVSDDKSILEELSILQQDCERCDAEVH